MSGRIDYLEIETAFLRASHRLVARAMRRDVTVLLGLRAEISRLSMASDAACVTEWRRLLARPAKEVCAALTRDDAEMDRLRQFSLVTVAVADLRRPEVRARLRAAAAKIASKRLAGRARPETDAAEPAPSEGPRRRRRRARKSDPSVG